VGILASNMAYGVVRQGFDPVLQVFLCQQLGSAFQLGLRPALIYKVGCTCVTIYFSQMGKRLSQHRATCTGGIVVLDSIRTINLNDYYYDY
jgi:hypothetical protein